MKLGFLTACLPQAPLDDIAEWAAGAGFEALEVAAWPRAQSRDYQASHIDVASLGEADAIQVRDLFDRYGLQLSALAFYENNLHMDLAYRAAVHDHLRKCVDAAVLLGCDTVGTFIGRDLSRSVLENLEIGDRVLPELVDYAGERGVRLAIENCPMEGWHPDGYPANLAYSPELWEWIFSLGFYLNFDPSHLMWLGIDPVEAINTHAARIVHVQAKDTQLDQSALNQYGFFGRMRGKANEWDTGWWRYRVPGRGQVDWKGVIDALEQGGFDGVVSVEHEDPVWGGSEANIKKGLEIAHTTLRPLIRA